MRFSKLIIKSIAQKIMAKYGIGWRFHDLKYIGVGNFFPNPNFFSLFDPLS
jgi:hypothetical protein